MTQYNKASKQAKRDNVKHAKEMLKICGEMKAGVKQYQKLAKKISLNGYSAMLELHGQRAETTITETEAATKCGVKDLEKWYKTM